MTIVQAPGGACSDVEARRIIGPDGAAALVAIIFGAWKDYVDEGKSRSRPARAMIVWDYMIQRADGELVKEFEGIEKITVEGSAAYTLGGRLLLRFKKHDRKMRTRNVATGVQTALASQGYLDGMPDLSHVTCGYVLDKAEAGIEKFVVVRSVPGSRWSIDLRELADGNVAAIQPILPGMETPAELAPLPTIRRRDTAGESDGQ